MNDEIRRECMVLFLSYFFYKFEVSIPVLPTPQPHFAEPLANVSIHAPFGEEFAPIGKRVMFLKKLNAFSFQFFLVTSFSHNFAYSASFGIWG